MFKNDRFLLAILIGIAALIALALTLFFMRNSQQLIYVDDSTPEGVVQNYVTAIYKGDYERAHAYLAEAKDSPNLETFRRTFMTDQLNISDNALKALSSKIDGKDATVEIDLIDINRSPFDGVRHNIQTVTLVNQSGDWKITWMPYPYWQWDWIQDASNTIKAEPAPQP